MHRLLGTPWDVRRQTHGPRLTFPRGKALHASPRSGTGLVVRDMCRKMHLGFRKGSRMGGSGAVMNATIAVLLIDVDLFLVKVE